MITPFLPPRTHGVALFPRYAMKDRKAQFSRDFAGFFQAIHTAGKETDSLSGKLAAEFFVAD